MISADNRSSESLTTGQRVQLKRRLGLLQCVAILVGLTIGTGIHVAPSILFRRVHSPGVILIFWVVSALINMTGGLTFAELACTFPHAGERYHYLDIMFGDYAAFLQLWQYLFFYRPSSNAMKSLVFVIYLLQPFFNDCPIPHSAGMLIACLLPVLVTLVNCRGVKWAASMQNFLCSLTVAALLIVAVTGFVYIGKGNTDNFHNMFDNTESFDLGDACLAMYSIIFTYGGWFALNYLVEEIKNPYRNLPIAIVLSILTTAVLYISVNIAYIAVLGPEGIRNSDAVAMTFADKTLGSFAWIIALLIAVNQAGSLNGGILVGSRLGFAAARRGHLPDVMSLIHVNYFSPITALLVHMCIIILLCLTMDISTLLSNIVFLNNTFDALTAYGLIKMRFTHPDIPRPLKLPLVIPIIYAICGTVFVLLAVITRPRQTAMGMLIVLTSGTPIYLVFIKKVINLSQYISPTSKRITVLVQKLFFCVPQEDRSVQQLAGSSDS